MSRAGGGRPVRRAAASPAASPAPRPPPSSASARCAPILSPPGCCRRTAPAAMMPAGPAAVRPVVRSLAAGDGEEEDAGEERERQSMRKHDVLKRTLGLGGGGGDSYRGASDDGVVRLNTDSLFSGMPSVSEIAGLGGGGRGAAGPVVDPLFPGTPVWQRGRDSDSISRNSSSRSSADRPAAAATGTACVREAGRGQGPGPAHTRGQGVAGHQIRGPTFPFGGPRGAGARGRGI